MPIDQTEIAPWMPTRPPAPLTVNPSSDLIATAFTSTSLRARTTAPDWMVAPVSFLMLPTVTAPPTPTKPPAMAPVSAVPRISFDAVT